MQVSMTDERNNDEEYQYISTDMIKCTVSGKIKCDSRQQHVQRQTQWKSRIKGENIQRIAIKKITLHNRM